MAETCKHEWVEGALTDGRPVSQCRKCPRWKLGSWRPSRDPESTRRSMEETSRYLGEHRDV